MSAATPTFLAEYEFGTPVTRQGQTTGYSAGYLAPTPPGTPAGAFCVMLREPVLPAPAFYYYPTLDQAWTAFYRNRACAQQLHSPVTPRPSLRELLLAEGLSPERLSALAQQAGVAL